MKRNCDKLIMSLKNCKILVGGFKCHATISSAELKILLIKLSTHFNIRNRRIKSITEPCGKELFPIQSTSLSDRVYFRGSILIAGAPFFRVMYENDDDT